MRAARNGVVPAMVVACAIGAAVLSGCSSDSAGAAHPPRHPRSEVLGTTTTTVGGTGTTGGTGATGTTVPSGGTSTTLATSSTTAPVTGTTISATTTVPSATGPLVSMSRGAPTTKVTCRAPSCAGVVVTVRGIDPPYSVHCYPGYPLTGPETYTTSSEVSEQCVWAWWDTGQLYVTVNGVESNRL